MALERGTKFGSYELAESIGAGGMGEVYKARDTRLKRDVALKVLPPAFVENADRLARFQREAEILASLNHPNIAQVHGLEKADGQTAIVMELVEGPTLADRIKDGPIPPDEAMGIALQVVSALEAAHEKHIVHRDLKPANVKVRDDGTVKVLDFGISKPIDPQAISGTPVMTTPAATQTGVILGTAAYMSPEQARGKFVDQRTDVWAFGCLLFEMLTGQPAFGGEDVMMTLARVLDRDTDLSSMPATISPAVRHTIKMCLEKDARKRVADIRDVRLALEGAFETAMPRGAQTAAPTASHRWLPIAIAATLAAAVGAAAFWILQPRPPPGILTRFNHAIPESVALRNVVTSVLDIAPSGEFFVVNGSDGISMRLMGDVESRVIPGTDGNIADVVVSPDGRDLVFFRAAAGGVQLVKVAIGGGAPIVLAEQLGNPFGISWESDGTILFGQPDGIWRVSENGGTPARIIAAEETEQAYGPQLLPGGDWVLFSLALGFDGARWNQADIVVESLTTGERRVLRSGGHDARYLPTGHLTYVFENVLFASAFDPASLDLDDERVSLIQGVQAADQPGLIGGSGFYAVANNGTLVFIPGEPLQGANNPARSLAWVDRGGNTEPLSITPDNYTRARISPDGTKVALVIGSTLPPSDPPPDIYVFDLETENLRQLTFNPGPDSSPVWSRDSSRIFFQSTREDGAAAVYVISADGGTAELFARSAEGKSPQPWSISADGETLLLIETSSVNPTQADIAVLVIDETDEVTTILEDGVFILEPALSPNGEWLAYYSSEEAGGAPSIDIRPFPDVNQQRRPVGAGRNPVFSADGSELFITDEGGISAIPVQYDPFRVGPREQLFRGPYQYGGVPSGDLGRAWDVDPVNGRFLMVTLPGADVGDGEDQIQLQINVVLNWFEELNQRVPVD